MAVNPAPVPALAALEPVRGSVRLIAARWVLAILAALPGIFVARSALEESAGRQPWFTTAPDPLPMPQLTKIFAELGPAVPALIAGVVVAWLAQLLLTAAAVEILDPRCSPAPARLWRRIFDTGTRHIWIYLRVSACALVVLLSGNRIVTYAFERLNDHAVLARWTGATILFRLPIARGVLLLAGAGAVGLLSCWSRVIVVAGRRHRVRRLPTMIFRAIRRWPVQGLIVHWIVGTASVVTGAAVLFAWRQSPGSGIAWFVLWLGLLLVQAFLWHWRLRTLCLIWSSTTLDDVRVTPDEPWHLFRAIRNRLRRSRDRAISDDAASSFRLASGRKGAQDFEELRIGGERQASQ